MLNSSSRIIRCYYPCYTNAVRSCFVLKDKSISEFDTAKAFDSIPGPRRLPLMGNLHLFSRFGPYSFDKLYDAYEDLYKKYGPVVRLDVGVSMVALFEPEDLKKVLHGKDELPERPLLEALRHYRLKNIDKYGSAGMVAENGEEWKRMRKAVKFILLPSFMENYLQAQEEIAADFVNRIVRIKDSNDNVKDFLREIYRFTEESIGLVCFGLRLGVLDESKSETKWSFKITQASEDTLQAFADTLLGFPWWKLFKTPTYRKLVDSQEFFHKFSLECMAKAEEKLKDPSTANDPTLNFYKTLSTQERVDYKEIGLLMTELFSAGIDATGNMIGFILYNLAKNPDAQEALYNEIQLHAPPDQPLTSSIIYKMKYLMACMRESYRLTPTAGGMARILKKPVVLSGYLVPEKVLCVGVNPIISRLSKHFPDPLQFKPERWLDPDEVSKSHPLCVLPFSHGVRSCIGQRIAEQEIKICIIKIIQKFRVQYKGPEIGSRMRLLLIPDKPLNFVFEDRIKK